MTLFRTIRAPVLAILVISTAAMFAREFARRYLLDAGYAADYAKDLSYLLVPVVFVLLMWPVFLRHRDHVRYVFRKDALTFEIVLAGIVVGVLMRLAWWSQLLAGISLGITTSDNPTAIIGPVVRFGCPEPRVILLGVFVMAALVPLIEELTHRGLLQSSLANNGKWFGIVGSAVLFTVFHPTGSYAFVFIAGVIMALQYWKTGALWFSLATHATYNGLIQFDWRCVTGQWSPTPEQVPMPLPAVIFVVLFTASALAIYRLVVKARWQPAR